MGLLVHFEVLAASCLVGLPIALIGLPIFAAGATSGAAPTQSGALILGWIAFGLATVALGSGLVLVAFDEGEVDSDAATIGSIASGLFITSGVAIGVAGTNRH